MADSSTYDPIIEQAGKDNNVDPDLIRSVIKNESNFNPKAVGKLLPSGQRAHGIAQLVPPTADALGVTDPFDPKQAIPAAAKLLAQNLDQYGNVPDAVSAYHGGTKQSNWGPVTQAYRDKVVSDYSGKSAAPDDSNLSAALFGDAAPKAGAQGAAPQTATDDDAGLKASLFGGSPDAATSDVTYKGGGEGVTPGQYKTLKLMQSGHSYDPDEPEGSEKNPLALKGDATADDVIAQHPEGTFYIDQAGTLNRTPVKGEGVVDRLAAGASTGVMDVGQSVLGMFPHAKDPNTQSAYTDLKASQMVYDAAHKGDLVAGAGRLTGQIIGAAPVMAAADAGAGAVGLSKLLGPVGTFIAGKAGQEAVPAGASLAAKGVQLGTKLASKMAQGAVQGGEAGALTSAASDAPLSKQIETGAFVGGALAPVGGMLLKGGKAAAMKAAGISTDVASLADQRAAQAAAQGLPAPVNLTSGQITGSPTQQMLENSMLKGVKGHAAQQTTADAAAQTDAALKANIPGIQSKMAGAPVAPNEGGIAVSNKLAADRAAAKSVVDANYDAARAVGGDAMLSTGKDIRDGVLGAVSKDYTLANVPRVANEIETIGEGGAPTVQELFDKRSRLSKLTQGSDQVEAGAARSAVNAMDSHIENAMDNDLFLGDQTAVDAWKKAVASRRDFGKAFQGDDFIEKLTEPTQHGGGTTLKVAPEDAANFIFGANDIGFTTKKNFTRDMGRLKDALGPDSPEWGALRAEAFARIARSAGPSDKPFSGAGFQSAWSKAKDRSPQAIATMFSPDEVSLIDNFADTARRATSPVKGGDNPSNSGIYLDAVKKFLGGLGGTAGAGLGGAVGHVVGGGAGAAAGATTGLTIGKALDSFFTEISNAQAAKNAVAGKLARPASALDPKLKLLGNVGAKAAVPASIRLLGNQQAASPAGQ